MRDEKFTLSDGERSETESKGIPLPPPLLDKLGVTRSAELRAGFSANSPGQLSSAPRGHALFSVAVTG
jgi:hypothetical protein